MTEEFISSAEFCQRAGCSYRQITYWLSVGRLGIIRRPGSGNRHRIPARLVPRARVLATLTRGFNTGQFYRRLIEGVFDHYDEGRLDFGGGVVLTWPVEGSEPEGARS